MSIDPYQLGALVAEKLLKDKGINTLPVDPFALAQNLEITVAAKPPDMPGVSGMLIRLGDEFAIAYSTHLNNLGFERFSVSHELGHYFLSGHPEAVFDDTGIHRSKAGFSSKDRYEMEADGFASGLLMPRHLFFPALQKAGFGLAAIEKLADLCQTSIHATAIRYAQCSRDPVAIVVSQGKQIDHCFMSMPLRDLKDIDWLRKRSEVPLSTSTYSFNQDAENVRMAKRLEARSYFQDWFGGSLKLQISEDILGLGNYGKTLTVLHEIDLPEEGEDDEEESLIESWTPRFRR